MDSPMAAISKAYIRSPSTNPYIRRPAVYSLAVSVRATISVVRLMRGPSACPYQTSAYPVG